MKYIVYIFGLVIMGLLQSLPVLPVVLLGIALRIRRQRQRGLAVNRAKEIRILLFALYLWSVLNLTLFCSVDIGTLLTGAARRAPNMVPVRGMVDMWRYDAADHSNFLRNVAGNLLLFLPFGYWLPLLRRPRPAGRGFWVVLAASAGTSLLIEWAQYYIGRSADIDDWILNTLGGVLGYGLYLLLKPLHSRRARRAQPRPAANPGRAQKSTGTPAA